MESIKNKEINIIQVHENEIKDLINSYNTLLTELIKNNKPLTAIEMFTFLDYSVLEIHKELTSIYSMIFYHISFLKSFNSNVLNILKNKKIIGGFFSPGLHKTYGMYKIENIDLPEGETIEKLSVKCISILNRGLRNDEYIKFSIVDEIIFLEIQYLIYILKDIVELDWPIEEENDQLNNEYDRYIKKEVKRSVWRRDHGRCVDCGSNEKLEYDHIIPVSKGGSNTERNIQLLCERCNRQKSAKIV